MRTKASLLVFVLAAAPLAAEDRDVSKAEIKAEKVGGSVWMLTGAGGNIGVSVGEDGVVVVDDQFAPLVPKIGAAIQGITPKPVRFLLNTHWHGDHTGGNAAFSKTTTVIAHDNVRKRLAEGMPDLMGQKIAPATREALPVITFDHALSIHLNGEDVRAIHFPAGHTDGDSVVFFTRSNAVHMGDDFVTYGFPFVDTQSGGSVVGMADAVEKVMAQLPDDVKVIPGHGALSTKADVMKFAAMLRDCVRLVSDARKAGKSIEQMKTENVLAKYDALGHDYIKTPFFIEQIAKELEGKPIAPSSSVHH
jgi:glyoxylase-like metal-dependent hydrolase (beta-lactamase superfamily II)